MHISTKPTIYLIDGLNIVRSFLYEFSRTEDEVTNDFLDFLTDASMDEHYSMNDYEVIFDGSFRPIGPLYRGGVHISFSEELSADQVIYEKASFLHQSQKRVIVVTDDRLLQDDLKKLGIKTLFCKKFYNSIRSFDK